MATCSKCKNKIDETNGYCQVCLKYDPKFVPKEPKKSVGVSPTKKATSIIGSFFLIFGIAIIFIGLSATGDYSAGAPGLVLFVGAGLVCCVIGLICLFIG